jgi:hypothetical protein
VPGKKKPERQFNVRDKVRVNMPEGSSMARLKRSFRKRTAYTCRWISATSKLPQMAGDSELSSAMEVRMSDSERDPNAYKTNLAKRFTERKKADGNGKVLSEKAVDYVYRAVDRQINKARGILAYSGLLFASFNLAARNSDKVVLAVANFGASAALASCFVLLYLMVFELGAPQNYEKSVSLSNGAGTNGLCLADGPETQKH